MAAVDSATMTIRLTMISTYVGRNAPQVQDHLPRPRGGESIVYFEPRGRAGPLGAGLARGVLPSASPAGHVVLTE